MNTVQKYFRLNSRHMAYLKFIVESYEGLAVLRTVDPEKGIIEWMIPPDRLEDAEELIKSLREEIPIEAVSPTRTPP